MPTARIAGLILGSSAARAFATSAAAWAALVGLSLAGNPGGSLSAERALVSPQWQAGHVSGERLTVRRLPLTDQPIAVAATPEGTLVAVRRNDGLWVRRFSYHGDRLGAARLRGVAPLPGTRVVVRQSSVDVLGYRPDGRLTLASFDYQGKTHWRRRLPGAVPGGLSVGPSGSLFVAVDSPGRVLSVSSTGKVVWRRGPHWRGRTLSPAALAWDHGGQRLIVASSAFDSKRPIPSRIAVVQSLSGTGVQRWEAVVRPLDVRRPSLPHVIPSGLAVANDGVIVSGAVGRLLSLPLGQSPLDAFIVKLSPSGDFLWSKTYGDARWWDRAAVAAVVRDDVIVGGETSCERPHECNELLLPLFARLTVNDGTLVSWRPHWFRRLNSLTDVAPAGTDHVHPRVAVVGFAGPRDEPDREPVLILLTLPGARRGEEFDLNRRRSAGGIARSFFMLDRRETRP